MDSAGLALAWRSAHQAFGAPAVVGQAVGLLAPLTFAVRAEFAHPVAGNLFGTPLISLLLLPLLLADASLVLARAAWVPGAVGMTVFAWTVVLRWLSVRGIAGGRLRELS